MKLIATLFLALLISACSSMPPHPLPQNAPSENWQLRQQQLSNLEHWQLSGRLAVQNGHEAWHMSLNWQQRLDRYSIHITAPLGQGSMKLHGDANEVMLLTDEGKTVNARDPEQLLYQQLGWKLPVSALRYWVLGLPAPGEHLPTLDEYGRLDRLTQAGWEIDLIDYQPNLGVELPRKVFLNNHQAGVKLVISRWSALAKTTDSATP